MSATFQYDGVGRRRNKTLSGTTAFLYDGPNIVQELKGGTPTANLVSGDVAYAPIDPASADDVMTVRDDPTARGSVIPRSRWRFVDAGTVALDGGFEPGRIYDVVYRSQNPKVVGIGLSGTRDLVAKGYVLPEDVADLLKHALEHYEWAVKRAERTSQR